MGVLFSGVLVGLWSMFVYVYYMLWLMPEKIRGRLQRQGINGPLPSFLYGNIHEMQRILSVEKDMALSRTCNGGHVAHNYASTLFPYFDRWRETYGPLFMYSTGTMQLLYVSDADLVKEISLQKSLDLGKPTYMQKERGPLFGEGILTSNGSIWAHQRKIIAPQFFMDKVKGMVDIMVESIIPLLKSWESRVDKEGGVGDIRVDEDLRSFSADVISRACFGSSYFKGKEIFLRLRALQQAMSTKSLLIGVPGLRYLPTKNNRNTWRLDREIRSLILKLVKERREESLATSEKDLLQTILEGANSDQIKPDTTDRFIVDNCKNIYFAGHETTAVAATWTLMLLALNPEWQTRARAEVLEVCGGQLPDVDMIRKMKVVTMVIQESLRLYPPAAFLSREALRDMELGGIHVPKGLKLWIPILTLHQNPDIWGPDAHEFNPERFAHGIFNACKLPHVYMPFGAGARTCVGQNFAMVELKVVLSGILGKFSFSLSPGYCHSPAFRLTVEPEHGLNLIIRRV
ncbi:cytochrome P450 714C2-like isoform X2 [Magnolia sinica]|uniref:cytochrome P450 714C2-like isoform X2 n=1 Tax=Magnolia sinica TaxID=86752 RepID=UPI0026590C2B|nr:cytochrome P450 714C2-like isoform X2 [Magnolia sinica]